MFVAYASMTGSPKKPLARVQYAALPFRHRAGAGTEVMLVTSRRTKRWIIPKGWPMGRKPPHAAAACEALEEAGVVGRIATTPIVVACEVLVFPLEVERQRKSWPEKGKRQVRWLSAAEAAAAVQEGVLGDIIRGLPRTRSAR